jgi:hypothetical protein
MNDDECTANTHDLKIMNAIVDLFKDHRIDGRTAVGMCMRIVFDSFKLCSTKPQYHEYLDRWKTRWDVEDGAWGPDVPE